jgi:hypothetical protein
VKYFTILCFCEAVIQLCGFAFEPSLYFGGSHVTVLITLRRCWDGLVCYRFGNLAFSIFEVK